MEGRTKSSGFKMKAGKEGPMKKNFPSAFKNRGIKDEMRGNYPDRPETTTGPRGSLSGSSSSDLTDAEKRKRDVTRLRNNKLGALYGQGGYLSGLDT